MCGRWQAPCFGNLVTRQEALSEMFLVAPCALSEGRAHSLELFAVFAVLSPLIDTSQMWVAFAQILPQVMRIRWSLSLIFLDFKCVTSLCDIARVITFPGFFFQRL